jgi:acyl-CoA thioesterase I
MRHLVLPLLLGLSACARPDTPAPAAPVPMPPPDTVRVAVLGNSLAAGYGLERPAEQAFPALVQAAADRLGWAVRVANHGVSGATTASGLARLDAVLADTVDVLVLELGGNDALRGLSPGTMRANLVGIVQRTRARYPDARIVIAGLTLPPLAGGGPYLAAYRSLVAAYRQAFEAAAAETDAAFVPSLLDGVAGVRALNQPDLIHPTAAGQQRLFENLWPVLRAEIAQARATAHTGRRA